MTKQWSSTTSDLLKTKRQASKDARALERRILRFAKDAPVNLEDEPDGDDYADRAEWKSRL